MSIEKPKNKPQQIKIEFNEESSSVEYSNFVVVTYWWGAPNQNANIARPCILFYETRSHYL